MVPHPISSTLNPKPCSVLVRATSEVSGKTFTLGEIAEITGGDKALRAKLALVEVGTSPLPGLSRIVLSGDVLVHLRAAHLDGAGVELVAPPTSRVSRIGHDVAGDEITRTAIEAGKAAIKDEPGATLEPLAGADKITVPTGKVRVIAGAFTGNIQSGTIYVPVSVFADGKLTTTVEIALRIRRKAQVLVARRTLEPHEIVTAADVMIAPAELPSGFLRPMTDLKEAIGKRTTRRIPADAPIGETMLETPPALAVGSPVTLEWGVGGIHIRAAGIAQQAGAIGDVIRVYASDTHKTLEAIIVDSHTVRIADTDSDAEESAADGSAPETTDGGE